MSYPVPSPFLLVEPTDPELADEPEHHRAVGWGLESATEALVYFKHPVREIREVGVFASAEHALAYYREWGLLDLLRPDQPGRWPADPGPQPPPPDDGRAADDPIWQAKQRPGAQLVHLYPPDH